MDDNNYVSQEKNELAELKKEENIVEKDSELEKK